MWMEQVTRNWLTLGLTGSALQLGAVNFVRFLPAMAVGMLAGVLADRFSKKRLLLIAQLWSLIVYAAMTWVVLSGELRLWHLYASSLALSAGMSVSQPVRAAFIPDIVPQQQVIGAMSLNAVGMNGSRFLLPALAGVLIAVVNPGWAYAVATGFYVLLQLFTVLIRSSHAPAAAARQRSMMGDLGEGLRFVKGERTILGLIASRLGPITVASGFQVLIPVLAVQALGMGPGGYGALVSAEGLGSIIGGAALASQRRVPHQGLLAIASGTALGSLLVAVAFSEVLAVTMLLFMIIGAAQITFQSSNNSALFGLTPAPFRGRMIGVRNQTRGLVPVSQLGAGALADLVGVSVAFAVVGGASLLIFWAVLLWRPELRKL